MNTNLEVSNPQPPKKNDLKAILEMPEVKQRFLDVLGKRAHAFMSSIISVVNTNNSLKKCEPMSVVSAAATAAAMDLPVTTGLGFAHIVPYRTRGVYKAQFQLGWKGFLQLALRSGQYKTVNITGVMEGEIKKHNKFTGEIEFDESARTSDNTEGYLLYFRLLNGYEKYFFMTCEEIRAHGKKYSASFKKNEGLWVDNFEAMALKTVAKLGLSKYGVLSVEMQNALRFDQAVIGEDGEPAYVDNRWTVSEEEKNRRKLLDQKYLEMEAVEVETAQTEEQGVEA